MATSNAARVTLVGAGRKRRLVAASPGSRPELRLAVAHPSRPTAPGRVGRVASCVQISSAAPSPWVRWKVAAVGALVLFGTVVSIPHFAAMGQPDPSVDYVAGDPAWAHVTAP